jgi:ABC-type lipoprotein export system ATPase subunit
MVIGNIGNGKSTFLNKLYHFAQFGRDNIKNIDKKYVSKKSP